MLLSLIAASVRMSDVASFCRPPADFSSGNRCTGLYRWREIAKAKAGYFVAQFSEDFGRIDPECAGANFRSTGSSEPFNRIRLNWTRVVYVSGTTLVFECPLPLCRCKFTAGAGRR